MAEIINIAGHAVTLLADDGASLFLVKGFRGKVDDKFLVNLDPNKAVLLSELGNLPPPPEGVQVDYGHDHVAAQIHNLDQAITNRVVSLVKSGSSNITIAYDSVNSELRVASTSADAVSLSDVLPLALGTADAGTGQSAAREDHVHELPTLGELGAAAASHNHTIAEVTGLSDALAGKSDTGHVHTIAEVTGLQDDLDGKADNGHTHAIADTTGLQDALDGKSDTGHSHTSANITDFADKVADRIGAVVTAADSSIAVQYSSLSKSLTIRAVPSKTPVTVEAVTGTISWEPIASNGYALSPDITMVGANLGDFVEVAPPYDVQGLVCYAYMKALNVAKIVLANLSGSAITLPVGNWRTRVIVSGPASRSGTTAERPTGINAGFQYFDTDLTKPIWYSGSGWVDATGTTV